MDNHIDTYVVGYAPVCINNKVECCRSAAFAEHRIDAAREGTSIASTLRAHKTKQTEVLHHSGMLDVKLTLKEVR